MNIEIQEKSYENINKLFEFTFNPKILFKLLDIKITKPSDYEYINFVRFEIENSKSEYRYTNNKNIKLDNIVSITTNKSILENSDYCLC